MEVRDMLSPELRQQLGLEREYGSVKMQPGQRVKSRTNRKRSRAELQKSEEEQKLQKISRGQQKRLERLKKEKDQKDRREALYQELQETALTGAQIGLMRRSGTLGQKDTARQRLQRDLHRVQAGLELGEDSRLVVERVSAGSGGQVQPQAESPVAAGATEQQGKESNEPASSSTGTSSSSTEESSAPAAAPGASTDFAMSFDVGVPLSSTGEPSSDGEAAAKKARTEVTLSALDPIGGTGAQGTSVPQNRASKTGGVGQLASTLLRSGLSIGDTAGSDLGQSLLLEADEAGEFKELRRLREKNRLLAQRGELAVEQPKGLGEWKGKKSVMRAPRLAGMKGGEQKGAESIFGDGLEGEEGASGEEEDGSSGSESEEEEDDDEEESEEEEDQLGDGKAAATGPPKKKYVVRRSTRKVGLIPGTIAASSTSHTRFKAVSALRRPALQQSQREKLPVYAMEQEIMEAVMENDVCIVAGETGSGKTTQVPQFLFENGFGSSEVGGRPGLVAVTQPRRVAAVTTAQRVADELGTECGPKGLVAYQVRYDSSGTGGRTCLKFMTDGLLLREAQSDLLLRRYSAIVLDEAHERNVNTDVLIGLLSRTLPLRRQLADEAGERWRAEIVQRLGKAKGADEIRRLSKDGYPPHLPRPLKLVIMSATLRTEDFTRNRRLFAAPPPVVTVKSRQFPVTMHFSRRTELVDYVSVAFKRVVQIHRKLPSGGILVFLTGKQDVLDLVSKLRAELGSRRRPGIAAQDLAKGDQELAGKLSGKSLSGRGAEASSDSAQGAAAGSGDDEEGVDFNLDDSDDDEHDWGASGKRKEASEEGGSGSKAMAALQDEEAGSASSDSSDSDSGSSSDSSSDSDDSDSNSDSSDSDEEDSGQAQGDEAPKPASKQSKAAPSSPAAPAEGTVRVLPLFAALPRDQQLRIFTPGAAGDRLIVVATNVAETSITIPGIRYVVDAGRQKRKVFAERGGVARFEVGWISKASSDQRSGRAGRTGPGHCYRLYSSAVYQDKFPRFEEPQVLRTPIDALVMQLKAIGIASVPRFPFPSPPFAHSLREAMKHLFAIGAIRPELPDDGEERRLVLQKARAGLRQREQARIREELADNRKAQRIAEGDSSSDEEEEEDGDHDDDSDGEGKSRSKARAEEDKADEVRARRQARKLVDSLPEAALLADAAVGETVTALGARVAKLPVAPALAKMLVLARAAGPRMVALCCGLVAALTVQELLSLPWQGGPVSDESSAQAAMAGGGGSATAGGMEADVAAAGFAGAGAASGSGGKGRGGATGGGGDGDDWGMAEDDGVADDWGADVEAAEAAESSKLSRREKGRLAMAKAAEKKQQQKRRQEMAQARAAFESIRHADSDALTLLRIVGAHAHATYGGAGTQPGGIGQKWRGDSRRSRQWCRAMHAREKQLQEVHLLRKQLAGLLLEGAVGGGAPGEPSSDPADASASVGGSPDDTEAAGAGELANQSSEGSDDPAGAEAASGAGAGDLGGEGASEAAVLLLTSPVLAPPTPAEEDALSQILCAGFIDRVARRAEPAELRQMGLRAPTGATPGQRVPYVSSSLEHREALYVHKSSALCAEAASGMPEWVVFGELQRGGLGGRTFMKQVTRISPAWLPKLARGTPLCVLGDPLASPPPAYSKKEGAVMCYRAPSFGERGWQLAAVKTRAEPSESTLVAFGRALLDGIACKQLRPALARLALPSSLLDAASTQSRCMALLQGLKGAGRGGSIDSKQALLGAWKEDPTRLRRELRMWVADEAKPRFDSKWASAVQRAIGSK